MSSFLLAKVIFACREIANNNESACNKYTPHVQKFSRHGIINLNQKYLPFSLWQVIADAMNVRWRPLLSP